METSGSGEKLQEFLSRLPKCDELENNEGILKAKATAAFFRGDFRELYKVNMWLGLFIRVRHREREFTVTAHNFEIHL